MSGSDCDDGRNQPGKQACLPFPHAGEQGDNHRGEGEIEALLRRIGENCACQVADQGGTDP